MRSPEARVHLLADHQLMEHVEALLTRKALTPRDMKELLPTVWWPAAAATSDLRISQAGHAAGLKVSAPPPAPAHLRPQEVWFVLHVV